MSKRKGSWADEGGNAIADALPDHTRFAFDTPKTEAVVRQIPLAGTLSLLAAWPLAQMIARVTLLAGSDLRMRDGVALVQDELVLLVKSGMAPMEALQAATRNLAEFMGTLATECTIEAGKPADRLLLDANPLEDIANTRRISAVVLSGRLVGGSLDRPR